MDDEDIGQMTGYVAAHVWQDGQVRLIIDSSFKEEWGCGTTLLPFF